VCRINKRDYSNLDKFFRDEASNEEELFHAMSLLEHMEQIGVTPDSYTCSILLNAWVQHSRPGNEAAADRAEELLRRNIQDSSESENNLDRDNLRWPNVKHYSSVLKAHAKTKSAGVRSKTNFFFSCMST
jgi:hypothetical protein